MPVILHSANDPVFGYLNLSGFVRLLASCIFFAVFIGLLFPVLTIGARALGVLLKKAGNVTVVFPSRLDVSPEWFVSDLPVRPVSLI